jgi:hypothetical protein
LFDGIRPHNRDHAGKEIQGQERLVLTSGATLLSRQVGAIRARVVKVPRLFKAQSALGADAGRADADVRLTVDTKVLVGGDKAIICAQIPALDPLLTMRAFHHLMRVDGPIRLLESLQDRLNILFVSRNLSDHLPELVKKQVFFVQSLFLVSFWEESLLLPLSLC